MCISTCEEEARIELFHYVLLIPKLVLLTQSVFWEGLCSFGLKSFPNMQQNLNTPD